MEANTSAHLALVEDVNAEKVIDAMRGIIHIAAGLATASGFVLALWLTSFD